MFLNFKSAHEDLALQLLGLPHTALIKALLDEKAIFIGGSLLAGFIRMQKWRLVKMICDFQFHTPSIPDSRAPRWLKVSTSHTPLLHILTLAPLGASGR